MKEQFVVLVTCQHKEKENKQDQVSYRFNDLGYKDNMLNATRTLLTFKPKRNYEFSKVEMYKEVVIL